MGIINNNHWLRTQTLLPEVFLHVSVWVMGNGHTTLICSFIYLSVGDLDSWCHRLPASIPRPAAFLSQKHQHLLLPSSFILLIRLHEMKEPPHRSNLPPLGEAGRRAQDPHLIHINNTHTHTRKEHTFECRTVKDRLQHTRECGGFFLKSRWPARYSVTFQGVK